MSQNLSLKLLQNIIAATKDAILITGPVPKDGNAPKIIYTNEAFTRMTGYSKEFAIGNTPQFLQGPKTDTKELALLRKSILNGQPFETTLINYKKNGDEFWNNFTISPVVDETGKCTNWIGIERDVTKQKNEELEKELLAQIGRNFSTESDYLEAARKLCETVSMFGEFDCVELWTRGLEENELSLLSHYMRDKSDEKFYQISRETTSFKKSVGLPGVVWKKTEQVLWGEAEMKEIFKRNDAAKKIGLTAVLGIPLFYNHMIKGVLLIGTKQHTQHLRKYTRIFDNFENFLGAEIRRKKVEHKLKQIFQATPDIICLTNSEGNILKINEAGSELLGYSESELLNQPLDRFFLKGEGDKGIQRFDQIKSGEKNVQFENRIINKHGEVVWLSWSCSASKEDGFIYASGKNITKEKELLQLNNQASSMAKIGSWEVDLINDKLFWSDSVHKIHETDSELFEPTVDNAIEFYREDFREPIISAIEQCILEGNSFDLEAVIVTAKNKPKWIRAIGSADVVNGECHRIFGSFQDIDDRKKGSEKLKRAYTEKNNILESIGEAFFAVDHDWTITYWNKQAESLFDIPRRKMLKAKISELDDPFKNTDFFKRCKKALDTGRSSSFEEYFVVYKKWFEISIFPNEEGLSVYFQNITRRKKSELQILEANERFEKVSEATTDAIWDWNIIDNNLYWGNSYYKLFGHKIDRKAPNIDIWTDNIHPDDYHRVTSSLRTHLTSDDNSWEKEYRYRRSDGTYAYVVDRGMIIRNKEQQPIRMIGAMTDISDRKKYEEKLIGLNTALASYTKELEQKNEDLNSFTFITSHDLQEPLRMISSFMDLLQKKYSDQLDDKAKEYIGYARKGAKRMKNMILDLLEYSRAGQIDANIETIEIKDIIEDFHLLRKKLITDRNVSIVFDELPAINTSKAAFTQVFHSLLDNAIKYTAKDVTPEITIRSNSKNEGFWEFSIEDNGIGIDPEFHDQIFTVFQRLHNEDEYSGTGIGLSIAKKQIENLKGEIWLKSDPGKGSTFFFKIPQLQMNTQL